MESWESIFFNKMGINYQIRELIMVKWDCNIEKQLDRMGMKSLNYELCYECLKNLCKKKWQNDPNLP